MSTQMGTLVHETVGRFEAGANQATKKQFAHDLMAALDKLGVDPGGDFAIVLPEEIQEWHSDYEDRLNEVVEQGAEDHSAVKAFAQLLADFRRGLLSADELLDQARSIVDLADY